MASLLDHTFDGDGRVIRGTGPNTTNIARALAVQPDGKLLVAGASGIDGRYRFGLIRYEPDSTFGGGSFVSTLLVEIGVPIATCLAVQPDGRIVVAGSGMDLAMVRYMPDGSLDTSFNGTGKLLGNVRGKFGTFYVSGVAIQTGGKMVVCDTNYYSPSPAAGNRGPGDSSGT